MSCPWVRPERPLVIAHRGLRAHVPEHTVASFLAAIDGGAEMIEADVLLSRDGELVLMHDTSIERTTNGTGRLDELTWAELSLLDAGSWFGADFANLRLARVADLLEIAGEAGIGLCLEAKGDTHEAKAAVALRLATMVRDLGLLDWVFVSSFDQGALASAKDLVPELLVAPERLPEHGEQDPATSLRQALDLGAPVIQHRWELVTPELLDLLHRNDIGLWAWNTNDAESVATTLKLDVDGIVGDDIALLVTGREDRARERRRAAGGATENETAR